jgi:hypothetical protein
MRRMVVMIKLRANLKPPTPFDPHLKRYPDYHCWRTVKDMAKQSGDLPCCGASSAFASWAASAPHPLIGAEGLNLRARVSGTLECQRHLVSRVHWKVVLGLQA